MKVAPEIKSAPINQAFEDFMSSFEAFKETNDRRLGEIESKMGEDTVTRDKVERINRAMDAQSRLIDEMQLKKARPSLGRSNSLAASEHKAAFENYIRRGDEHGLRALEAKAISTTESDGGYLVPDETDTEIGRRLTAVSPIRQLATVRQVSGAVLKKPFIASGFTAGWVGEIADRDQTATPDISELSFPTMELYAMPAASASLLDDAAVDVESWIASEIDIAFAEQESAAFINGSTSTMPKGFLSYTNVAESAWEWGKIGYVATGAEGAFKAADPSDTLIETIYSLKAAHRQNAHFVMNRKTQGTIRKFKDDDGNYLWQPPAGLGQSASIMGFPVTEAEDMPDIGIDETAIAFGDFAAGYLVVDRTGVRVLRDPYSAKPYVLFYTTKRVGGGVQNFEAIKLIKFGEA
ncbi:phage major capsid protein [Martelella soudanensis]|uniref:phage major capsid protein n=1 Tax=unclassified Martelella TaxID=2629616 RepID=UPI0015DFCB20|nr:MULTISPECIES: phage major capsid protein [unclassified Martelella]